MPVPVPDVSPGMCSVTLRHLSVQRVVEVAASAGLACIEWGADVHVPPGDIPGAKQTCAVGLDEGIRVASYGSYFRAGRDGADAFAPVLATAVALGAPRIRIWAGDVGSADATPEQRRSVTAVVRSVAERAVDVGVELAFEYHGGTLTDTTGSALRLLHDVDHAGVRTYWQPAVSAADTDALQSLECMLPWVTAVHVFSWWPGVQRLPLQAREALWGAVFGLLRRSAQRYDALLEFVRDDDPARVVVDAAALVRLATGCDTAAGPADVTR
jgi:sugar phosphate isomerase/epimerase